MKILCLFHSVTLVEGDEGRILKDANVVVLIRRGSSEDSHFPVWEVGGRRERESERQKRENIESKYIVREYIKYIVSTYAIQLAK